MTPRETIDHLRHLARKAGGAGDTITMTYGVRNSPEPAVAIGLTTFAALLDVASAAQHCLAGDVDQEWLLELSAALKRLSEAAGGGAS